jgi:hypothetical protein
LRTRRFLTSGDSSRIAAIDRVVKESTNVVDEEWIEEFGNLLLVGEFKGTFEWNPDAFQMHGPYLHDVFHLLALQDAIATTTSHACYVEKLGTVYHVVILSPSNTSAFNIHLKAQCSLILP